MSGRGESGRLALSSVDGEAEIGRGKNLENFLLFINPFLREIIADAQHNGEKCAKHSSRIIELAETDICNVACSPPGMEAIENDNRCFKLKPRVGKCQIFYMNQY